MSQRETIQISPISAWTEGELVKLPSGKVYRLRQLDVLNVIGPDGNMPNFLLPLLSGTKATTEVNPADILGMSPLLNKIASESVVEPAIVATMDAVNAGEGITLNMIPMQDKMGMLNFAMGGQAAVDAAMRFQPKQDKPVDAVQQQKQRVTEQSSGN